MGARATAIEHVGSTAVPGLGAKPIIDIVVAVRRLGDVKDCIEPLGEIGYEYLGEFGITERYFFRKPPEGEVRRYHLHVVKEGSDLWERHITFRDFLRSHPEVAREYYELKVEAAERWGADREAYTEAKSAFIRSVMKKAHTWRTRGGGDEGEKTKGNDTASD